MPRGDRTGPNGSGPMTGRRLGFCTGNDRPGYEMIPGGFDSRAGRRYGRGYGRGYGYGRGMGYRHGQEYGRFSDEAVPDVSQETLLENEARILKEQLASLEKQLAELKKGK
ncbi:MAG: DUF5320 domain-containing protein [Bacteroidetes bacterium]|nr:DUF5320 domain-containing protein [Bacteroidota bacterium]